MSSEILAALDLEPVNNGACTGEWIETSGDELVSINPANGEPIASVRQATAAGLTIETHLQQSLKSNSFAKLHQSRRSYYRIKKKYYRSSFTIF